MFQAFRAGDSSDKSKTLSEFCISYIANVYGVGIDAARLGRAAWGQWSSCRQSTNCHKSTTLVPRRGVDKLFVAAPSIITRTVLGELPQTAHNPTVSDCTVLQGFQ